MNHNHYVLDKGLDFTPERFKQHMNGFVKAQKELAEAQYIDHDGKYLSQQEADAIIESYREHWEKINCTMGETLKTELQIKKEMGQKLLTREDKHEWVKYGNLVDEVIAEGYEKIFTYDDGKMLVRAQGAAMESQTYLGQASYFTVDPTWDLERRIEAIKRAMRGGFSNRAHVRQIDGSAFPCLAEVSVKNDASTILEHKKR